MLDDLRKVSIKDLLGRDAVPLIKNYLSKNITGKVVIVTGAGGQLDQRFARQIITLKPKRLILYEMSELALYTIEKDFQLIACK